MKTFQIVFLSILSLFYVESSIAQSGSNKKQIISILSTQQDCWNNGDLECFMNGYWKSDSLKFIGSRGLTFGWQKTLDNYKKSYPDKEAMGKLEFDILSVELIGERHAHVIGKWSLDREKDDIGGYFSLIWKKMDEKWVIIADHSS